MAPHSLVVVVGWELGTNPDAARTMAENRKSHVGVDVIFLKRIFTVMDALVLSRLRDNRHTQNPNILFCDVIYWTLVLSPHVCDVMLLGLGCQLRLCFLSNRKVARRKWMFPMILGFWFIEGHSWKWWLWCLAPSMKGVLSCGNEDVNAYKNKYYACGRK